ncbi:MAG: SPOR domain-containing protein [Fluviicola sp.]|nr:SPOR domain-containing protein [Fluviicola sp.]MBP6271457.1 SPOR domain-containing protein [Fluviicola sp.]
MNNYLLLLLKELKTIIIPGLGALTITNEATNELLFMPFLKYDDGTLSKYIADKEGMSENDAKNLVSKFVREVLAELDKGEPYDMYQFGSFLKENNEIVFKQWEFQSEEQNESENQNENEDLSEEQNQNDIQSEEQNQNENESENDIQSEEQSEEQSIIQSENESESENENENENENEIELGEETQVVETIKQKQKQKQKTNWLSHVVLAFLVLLLSAGTYIAINYNTLKKDVPLIAQLLGEEEKPSGLKTISTEPIDTINETVVTEKVPEELTITNTPPTVSAEKKVVKSKVEKPVVVTKKTTSNKKKGLEAAPKKVNPQPKQATKPTVKKAPQTVVQATTVQPKAVKPIKATPSTPTNKQFPSFNNLPFQLIAGSFSSQQAAEKQATLLARKGITTCAISQFDGKFRVSLQGYATKESAIEGMNSFKQQVSDAWVFEVK